MNHLNPHRDGVLVFDSLNLVVVSTYFSLDTSDTNVPPPSCAYLITYNRTLGSRQLITIKPEYKSLGRLFKIPGTRSEILICLETATAVPSKTLFTFVRYDVVSKSILEEFNLNDAPLYAMGDVDYVLEPNKGLLWILMNTTVLMTYDLSANKFSASANLLEGANIPARFSAYPPDLVGVKGKTVFLVFGDNPEYTFVGSAQLPSEPLPSPSMTALPSPSSSMAALPSPLPSAMAALPSPSAMAA
jgi:hypothetical protein